MATPYVGEIRMFGGNFAPKGWALCDGQILNVRDNEKLFSVLGSTYGGNGRTTFGLPDLRGRVPIHDGSGLGLTPRSLGTKLGVQTVTLASNQVPTHSHVWHASSDNASGNTPANQVLGNNTPINVYNENTTPTANLASQAVDAHTGSGLARDNEMPFLGVNFIIALAGTKPTQT